MNSDLPTTQRAWVCTGRGASEKVMQLRTDYPVPSLPLAKGHVLVKVQASGLNPVEIKLMSLVPIASGRPTIVAYEFAGTIIAENASEFDVGDDVAAFLDIAQAHSTKQGGLAEYVAVPASNCIKRPANITPTQAAGVLLTAETAWQSLFTIAKLVKGQHVFINGGSTTVGSFAIQFAKIHGCMVTATASARNETYVRELGADEFVDYTKQDLVTHLVTNPPAKMFDVMLECVGFSNQSLYLESKPYLAPTGTFISVGPVPHSACDVQKLASLAFDQMRPTWLGAVKAKWTVVTCRPNEEDARSIMTLLAEGKVRPLMDSVYSMEDTLKAYERVKSGRATGKVIVKIDPNVE